MLLFQLTESMEHLGPCDLSGSIGKPGQWNDIEVKKALTSYEKAAKKYGKLMGYHVMNPIIN